MINEAGAQYEIDIDIKVPDSNSTPTPGPSPTPAYTQNPTGMATATENLSHEETRKIMGIDTPHFFGFLALLITICGVAITLFVKWKKSR